MASAEPIRPRLVRLYVVRPPGPQDQSAPLPVLDSLEAVAHYEDAIAREDPESALLGGWYASLDEFRHWFRRDSIVRLQWVQVTPGPHPDEQAAPGRWPRCEGVYDPAVGATHLALRLPADTAFVTADSARGLLYVLLGQADDLVRSLHPHERLDTIRLCHYYGLVLDR